MNRTVLVGTVGTALLASCLVAAQPGSGSDKWIKHVDPAGFACEMPQGWSAEGAKDGHVLIHSADKTVFAVLQPFKSPNGGASSEWIGPLVKHMSSLFPNVAIIRTETISSKPDEAIAKLTYTSGGRAYQANVLCHIDDGAGMFFAISAPADSFAVRRVVLIKTLRSFHYTSVGTTASTPAAVTPTGPITYVSWKEPRENAYTTEVPKGWKVTGGVFRYAPVDVRPQLDLGSPNGSYHIMIGDASLATFAPPGPSSQVRGLNEGGQYEVNGVPYIVMSYINGADFSRVYVDRNLSKNHPGIHVGETTELPEEAERARKENVQHGVQNTVTVGETRFTYPENGRTVQGTCIVRTETIGSGPSAIWHASPNTVTSLDNVQKGKDVMNHVIRLVRINPEWEAENVKIAKHFAQQVIQNHEQVMAQLKETYERFTHQMAENQRQWSNVINNEVDLKNPVTGETFKAEGGHNYYYEKGGTAHISSRPAGGDIDVTPLQQY